MRDVIIEKSQYRQSLINFLPIKLPRYSLPFLKVGYFYKSKLILIGIEDINQFKFI